MITTIDLDLPDFMDGPGCIPKSALQYLEQAGAGSIEHGHGSFLKHLIETWSILRWWKADEAACLAGLFHSVYSTDAFPKAIVPIAKRNEVAQRIGTEAEHLVHLFHRANRRALWAHQARGKLLTRDGQTLTLAEHEIACLAIVEAANIAQQAARADGAPTLWFARLANLHQIFSTSMPRTSRPAAPFRQISDVREQEALAAYLQVYNDTASLGHELNDTERNLLLHCHACLPCAHEPLLWLALDAFNRNDARGAERLATKALRCARTLGVTWDKRISWTERQRLLNEMAAG
jgi:hypothetical protein